MNKTTATNEDFFSGEYRGYSFEGERFAVHVFDADGKEISVVDDDEDVWRTVDAWFRYSEQQEAKS
jgi:hypothetical protein